MLNFSRTFCMILILLNSTSLFSINRGSSAPFISGDTFRSVADHIYDETAKTFNPENVKEGDVVFIKTDYLETFFSIFHPQIQYPYIVVTHNSDHSAPGPCYNILDSEKKIIAWFGQNVEGKSHPKLFNIPIGIANKCWGHGNVDVFLKYSKNRENQHRPYLCYMNFSPSTYPIEREGVWDYFSRYSWCKKSSPKSLDSYLGDTLKSKFVLSPRGNGIDCHRTWEALLMGAIPIVKSSTLDPLYKDLPVLIVDNWEDINKEYLEEKYEEMKEGSYDYSKLFFGYWANLIRSSYKRDVQL